MEISIFPVSKDVFIVSLSLSTTIPEILITDSERKLSIIVKSLLLVLSTTHCVIP